MPYLLGQAYNLIDPPPGTPVSSVVDSDLTSLPLPILQQSHRVAGPSCDSYRPCSSSGTDDSGAREYCSDAGRRWAYGVEEVSTRRHGHFHTKRSRMHMMQQAADSTREQPV